MLGAPWYHFWSLLLCRLCQFPRPFQMNWVTHLDLCECHHSWKMTQWSARTHSIDQQWLLKRRRHFITLLPDHPPGKGRNHIRLIIGNKVLLFVRCLWGLHVGPWLIMMCFRLMFAAVVLRQFLNIVMVIEEVDLIERKTVAEVKVNPVNMLADIVDLNQNTRKRYHCEEVFYFNCYSFTNFL